MTSWFRLILQKVAKKINKMLYKARTLVISVPAFSRRASSSLTGKLQIVNSNVIVVIERSDHDTVASMSCLEKVVADIESKHGSRYENLYIWSDGIGAQFRSCFVCKLLTRTVLRNKSLCGSIMNAIMGKVPWIELGEQWKIFYSERWSQVKWS